MMAISPLSFFQCLILILLLLDIPFAFAVPKTALIIGNSEYSFSPLKNPANDATEMAKSLRELGFEVSEHINLDRVNMRKAIREFGLKLKKGGVGLFFFAGHGIQVKGKNYLIPVDSDIASEDEVVDESIDANMVLRKMETAGNDFNIVIMDACRNNPFARSFRSAEQGLARMEGPVGSIIAYATSPGSTAADGAGKNGLYTSYFLKAMKEPGLSIEDVFKKVRNNVRAETKGKQIPWESSSLTGNFHFTDDAGGSVEVSKSLSSPPPPIPQRVPVSHLQITTNLAGGKVFIDDIEKGIITNNRAFNIQNMTQLKVKVFIKQEGYKSTSQTIKLVPNEWQQVYIELIPVKKVVDKSLKTTESTQTNTRSPQSETKDKVVLSSNKRNKVRLTNTSEKSIKSMDFDFGKNK